MGLSGPRAVSQGLRPLDRAPEGRPSAALSLWTRFGAFGAEQSVRFYEMLGDPIQGALFAGPPFATPGWRSVTAEREPGSPAWLPRFDDGSIIRFTGQENALDIPGAKWGPMRIVYLQYASDPIVFFEPAALYRSPAWMAAPRGPDVSPDLRWYPLVTFMQLMLDMAVAVHVPIGHGHLYAHAHYIDAWQAVDGSRGLEPCGHCATEGAVRRVRGQGRKRSGSRRKRKGCLWGELGQRRTSSASCCAHRLSVDRGRSTYCITGRAWYHASDGEHFFRRPRHSRTIARRATSLVNRKSADCLRNDRFRTRRPLQSRVRSHRRDAYR